MRFCSGQTRAKCALFARLRATGGTTNRLRFFLYDFHTNIMRGNSPIRWSIVTIARSHPRRIIATRKGGGPTLEGCTGNASDEGQVSPLDLFSGVIPCSINWLHTEIDPPRRRWRILEHHQTPKALGRHRCLGLHIRPTPKSLRCPTLFTSPTPKSPWMSLLTSLTKAYSRGANRESCNCRGPDDRRWRHRSAPFVEWVLRIPAILIATGQF